MHSTKIYPNKEYTPDITTSKDLLNAKTPLLPAQDGKRQGLKEVEKE